MKLSFVDRKRAFVFFIAASEPYEASAFAVGFFFPSFRRYVHAFRTFGNVGRSFRASHFFCKAHKIRFSAFAFRRSDAVRKFSVGCKDEQAFGIAVKPSDRVQIVFEKRRTVRVAEQIENRSVKSVALCAHITRRLVHHEIDFFSDFDFFTVRGDDIALFIDTHR